VAFSQKTARTRYTHQKTTTCSVDKERNKKGSAISTRSQTSTSSNVAWKSTVS